QSHVIIVYQTWSFPVQMRALATAVSEYRRGAKDDTTTLPMNVYFDHTTQVTVPGDFNLLIAHVKTFTGKTYDFSPDTQSDPHGLIVKSAISPAPGPDPACDPDCERADALSQQAMALNPGGACVYTEVTQCQGAA